MLRCAGGAALRRWCCAALRRAAGAGIIQYEFGHDRLDLLRRNGCRVSAEVPVLQILLNCNNPCWALVLPCCAGAGAAGAAAILR